MISVDIAELAQLLGPLKRPLTGVDTETTGTSPNFDRIVQIGIVKVYPDGRVTNWKSYIDPGEPIPRESTKIHGITDAMVQNAPKFKDLLSILRNGFDDCDITGYTVRFDASMIVSEFRRIGIPSPKWVSMIDPYKIYMKHRRRDLQACIREYLGEEAEKQFLEERARMAQSGSHDAHHDITWTMRCLVGQLRIVPEDLLPRDTDKIHDLYEKTIAEGNVTPDGKIILRNGIATLNFTKDAGTPMNRVNDGMLGWIISKDFVSEEVKIVCREELSRRMR